MVALKAAEVDSFVARPSPDRPIVLVCGPDAGLVHERAEKIIKASVDDLNDPFALPQQPPYVPQPIPHHDNKGFVLPNFGSQPNFGNQTYVEPPARQPRDGYQPRL